MTTLLTQGQWQDVQSTVKVTGWHQPTVNQNIASAIAQISRATNTTLTYSEVAPGVNNTMLSPSNVLIGAKLGFVTVNGGRAWLLVPGADPSIYLADGETVDPTNTGVANLIGVFIANGVTAGGVAIAGYVTGTRIVLPSNPLGH